MIILGINSVYHESSACILINGKLLAASEEERFNRIKHGKNATPESADQLPINSINFCLEKAGVSLTDVDYIAFSFDPDLREKTNWPKENFIINDWGSSHAENQLLSSINRIQNKFLELDFKGKIVWIEHEMCHAASSYYCSPFVESAVLSIDGIGEEETTALYQGNGINLTKIESIKYPNSLGFLWEKFCKYLGFSEYHACKLMGLAAYGDEKIYQREFNSIIQIEADGLFRLNNEILQFRSNDFSQLESVFNLKKREPEELLTFNHKNVAATLQWITDKIVNNLARRIHKTTGSKNLCLAGGVALNCVANSSIVNSNIFENIFINPGAHDAGTSIGAAFSLWHNILRSEQRFVLKDAYLGPSFSDTQCLSELILADLKFEKISNIEERTAQLIAEGAVVGWFQGRMEFGPRALGNRSLLADPRNPKIRDILNIKVKHREIFRPFAPSILIECADDWFDINSNQQPNDYMLLVNSVHPEKQKLIPAVLHVDGTARIQKVKHDTNPRFYKLISEFNEITGVPILLNTSFNDDEPIVCTPKDAIETFKKTAIDYLVLNDFLISRP